MLWRWSHKKSEEENTKESEERADTEARGRIGGLRDLPLNSATRSTYWSFVERWHIFGAGHSRTLRHDWHGYLSLQWYEMSQDVPSMDSDIWVAFDLFYVLVHLYSSS